MKSCEEVLDLLPEVLPVIRGEAIEVHEHLKLCPDCAETAEDVAHTLHALKEGADPAPELGPEFADAVLAALPPAEPAPIVAFPAPRPLWPQLLAAGLLFAAGLGTALAIRSFEPAPAAQNPLAVQPDAQPREETPIPRVAAPQQRPQLVGNDVPRPRVRRANDLSSYVSEASLVLQAVESLKTADPRTMRLLAKHLQRTELLEQGDQLLLAIRQSADPRAEKLKPLITGTQLILRKVRHAPQRDTRQALWAIHQEVRQTKILDAYRALVRRPQQPQADPETININDPL